jgi:hypothetical protein
VSKYYPFKFTTLTGAEDRAEDRKVVHDFRDSVEGGLVSIDEVLEKLLQVIGMVVKCKALPRTKFTEHRLKPKNVRVEFRQLSHTVLLKFMIVLVRMCRASSEVLCHTVSAHG